MVGFSSFGSPDLPWGEKLPHILVDETLKEIAARHGQTTAAVVLRWQMQRGVGVIPKVQEKKWKNRYLFAWKNGYVT